MGVPVRGWIVAISIAAVGGAALGQSGIDLAERKLITAEGLAGRGQWDLAKADFDEFLKTYPNDRRTVRARFGRGLSAYNLNDPGGAAKDLEAVVTEKTFDRRDEALAVLAAVYLASGDGERALKATDVLLKDHAGSAQVEGAMVNRAQALYRLGRYEESRAEAAAMLKVYPKSAHRAAALYVVSLDQRAMGNDAAAETVSREIVEKFPNAPYVWDAQVMIGETLAGQGKVDAAVAHFKAIDAEAPAGKKAAVQFGLGMTLGRAARYEEARRAFETVITRYPESPYVGQAKLQSAVTLVKTGDRDKARTALAAVAQGYPALAASASYWTARCELLDSKFESAKALLERLVTTKPTVPEISEVTFDLAYCELALGQDAAAIKRLEAYRAAYPYSPHMAEALYYQATALHRKGDFGKSLEFCNAVLKLGSTNVTRQAEMLKGENLLMQKEYREADGIFTRLDKDAKDAEKVRLALRRGQAAYYGGDFKTAVERLEPVAKKGLTAEADPMRAEAVFLQGDALLQLQKFSDAAKSFELYLSATGGKGKTPRWEEGSFKLAVSQLGGKDRKAAAATLAEMIKGDTTNEWVQRAWFEWGQMAYEDRRLEDAGKAADRVLEAKPGEAVGAAAMYLAGRVALESGKADDAAKRMADLVAKWPKHPLAEDATYARGAALKEAGKAKEAVAQFDAYIAAYPKGKFVTEAWHQGAASLTASGKAADAIKILSQLAGAKETRSDAVLYDLAWAQRSSGDGKSATATYEAMIKEFPASARVNAARVELADLYSGGENLDGAVELLSAALKDPNIDRRSRAVALYRLGTAQLRRGEAARAAAAFDQFVAENPKDPLMPSALCEAGAAYARADQLDAAKTRLQKVIDEFPKVDAVKLAIVRMGDLQNQVQQYETAQATFEKWLKDHPGDALTALAEFGIGWSLESRGLYGRARERYTKVIGLDKGATAARAQFQIGETYFKEKKYETAAKELLTVDILYKSPEWAAPALYEAGCAFDAMGDAARARGQWEECVKKYPRSTVAGMAKKKLEGAK